MLLIAGTCFSQNHILRTFEGKKIPAKHVKSIPLTTKHTANPFGAKSIGDTITSFPWTEDFEDSISGYTFIDYDNDGFNWWLGANEEYAHSGETMVVSESFDVDAGELSPDNWMILPTFVIPVDSTNMPSFGMKGHHLIFLPNTIVSMWIPPDVLLQTFLPPPPFFQTPQQAVG